MDERFRKGGPCVCLVPPSRPEGVVILLSHFTDVKLKLGGAEMTGRESGAGKGSWDLQAWVVRLRPRSLGRDPLPTEAHAMPELWPPG